MGEEHFVCQYVGSHQTLGTNGVESQLEHAVVTFRRIVDRRDHAGFITGIVYHAYEIDTGQSVFDGQIPPNGDEAGHIRTIVRTKYREQRFAVHAYIPFILQSGQYCMEMVDVILFSGISLFQ